MQFGLLYPRLSMLSIEGLTVMTSCSNCRLVGGPSAVAGVIGPPLARISSGETCVTVVCCAGCGWLVAVCCAGCGWLVAVCCAFCSLLRIIGSGFYGSGAKAVPYPRVYFCDGCGLTWLHPPKERSFPMLTLRCLWL